MLILLLVEVDMVSQKKVCKTNLIKTFSSGYDKLVFKLLTNNLIVHMIFTSI